MNDFPTNTAQLNCNWLSEALGHKVSDFKVESLGEGKGVIGQVTRLWLETGTGPKSIIAKFPSPVASNRAVAASYDMYGKEFRFYTDIAPTIPLKLTRCYFGAYNAETQDFILLLEDLSAYRAGDQIKGCSVDDTFKVIEALACLHASSWDISPSAGQPGNRFSQDRFTQVTAHNNKNQRDGMIAGFKLGWPVMLEQFSDLIPESARHIEELMPDAIPILLDKMCQEPMCLSHGDSRLDNMFFSEDGVLFIDWQATTASAPEHDLAYFLTQSLSPEVFEAKDWVAIYHAELSQLGIEYPLAQCRKRFKICALYLLNYAVVIAGTLDLTNERGRLMAKTLLGNGLRSLDKLQVFSLLDEITHSNVPDKTLTTKEKNL